MFPSGLFLQVFVDECEVLLRNFLVQVALAEEFAWFLSRTATTRLFGRSTDTVLTLDEDPRRAIVISGVGKVAAASAVTRALALRPDLDAVVSFGVSGSLHEGLAVGDLVVASGVVEHDFDAVVLNADQGSPGVERRRSLADPTLAAVLREHCDDLAASTEDCEWWSSGGVRPKIITGELCSGDQLITSSERRERLTRSHPASCAVDMETAAVAYVADLHRVPWGAVRMISDGASEALDLGLFLDFVATKASRVLGEIFNRLVQREGDVSQKEVGSDRARQG